MLGGQPNHGWQLCFPLQLHAGGPDFGLYDGSDLCFRARPFIDALLSCAGKGLTSWLSFGMSYFEVVTFPLVCMKDP